MPDSNLSDAINAATLFKEVTHTMEDEEVVRPPPTVVEGLNNEVSDWDSWYTRKSPRSCSQVV